MDPWDVRHSKAAFANFTLKQKPAPIVPSVLTNSFNHLLSSNAPPNALDTTLLVQKINAWKNQISVLEKEVKRHQAIFSPLRRLPPVVLGEIFKFALPGQLDENGRGDLVSLCLVCKAWRDAARLVRRIWSSIKIDLPLLSYEKIEFWLSRSGNVPRRIEISDGHFSACGCPYSRCKLTGRKSLMRLLTDGPHLDHLHIEWLSVQCIHNFLNALQSSRREAKIRPWDSLRSLSFNIRQATNDDSASLGHRPSESIFLDFPLCITTFHITLPSMEGTEIEVPLGFLEGLTSFSVECTGSKCGIRLLKLLQDCVNVEILTLSLQIPRKDYGDEDPEFEEIANEGLTFPKVHTLRLRHLRPSSTEFIDMFTTPALVDLDLSFQFSLSNKEKAQRAFTAKFVKHLKSFILERSGCRDVLHTLRIHDANLDTDAFVGLLAELPFLTHLTLDRATFDAEELFFNLQTTVTGGFESLLRLQVLELLQVAPAGFDFNDVFTFLCSRSPSCFGANGTLLGGPPGSVKKLTVTFLECDEKSRAEEEEEVDSSMNENQVLMLRRQLGIAVELGPRPML